MAGLRRPASTRGEMDASARSLDVVGLAARKEGRTASPSPALRLTPAQASGVLARSSPVQRTPSSPRWGLADGGTTVGHTPEQVALCRWCAMERTLAIAPQKARTARRTSWLRVGSPSHSSSTIRPSDSGTARQATAPQRTVKRSKLACSPSPASMRICPMCWGHGCAKPVKWSSRFRRLRRSRPRPKTQRLRSWSTAPQAEVGIQPSGGG